MAGAGFKTFNTGDVFTASDANTYLMQQTVMVFASAAARTTALGANVAEGMMSYLKDTDAVEVYNGSAWVASDDPNAIQNTIVDAKGDLISATAADTPARLAVGANGEMLVADSSTSTGLRWQGLFAAGRNALINGDFGINQRAFSSTTSNNTYTFDRWITVISGGSTTVSAQTFTVGAAPVAGYESTNFLRLVTSSQGSTTFGAVGQRIEDVRSFANQSVLVSFWAKASTGTPKVGSGVVQNFGSGGSAEVVTYASTAPTISTSWARYSIPITVPSISGKTIGTSSYCTILVEASDGYNASLGAQNATIDIWGVQVEAGSVATPFQTATGTKQGELAACQRYYWRSVSDSNNSIVGQSSASTTTAIYVPILNPVPMRILPTSVDYSTLQVSDDVNAAINLSATPTIEGSTSSRYIIYLTCTVASGMTQYRSYRLRGQSTSSYIGFSAEL